MVTRWSGFNIINSQKSEKQVPEWKLLGEGNSSMFENLILIPIEVPGNSGPTHQLCKVDAEPKATVDCFIGACVLCY
jgi:hypothetical protein